MTDPKRPENKDVPLDRCIAFIPTDSSEWMRLPVPTYRDKEPVDAPQSREEPAEDGAEPQSTQTAISGSATPKTTKTMGAPASRSSEARGSGLRGFARGLRRRLGLQGRRRTSAHPLRVERFTVVLRHRTDGTPTRRGVSLADVVRDGEHVVTTYRSDLTLDPDFYRKAARAMARRLNERLEREGEWWTKP